ncbi:hypothetical protein [Flavobacterium algicola]|uniref:hypothetical protein n=1 Tax=Flavobacterium algicola TaxID=556529 RepID=UPI001EFE0065|nr:hypothetical protein [Flavobacterium algicola]MCG9790903.1 hypothetical protein [Flavobacterium algicola]
MKTIRNTIAVIGIFTMTSVNAQTDLQKLKEKVAIQEQQISAITKENVYYKDALHLTTSTIQAELESVKYQINSVTGDKQNNTVVIEGLYTNQGEMLKALQVVSAAAIDPKGVQHGTYLVALADGTVRVENIYTDIPMKFTITFKNFDKEIPLIRVLTLGVYSHIQIPRTVTGKFENLNITWK